MQSGWTTLNHWIDPRKEWSFCVGAGPGARKDFLEECPPLPGIGFLQGCCLWPNDKLVRIASF